MFTGINSINPIKKEGLEWTEVRVYNISITTVSLIIRDMAILKME